MIPPRIIKVEEIADYHQLLKNNSIPAIRLKGKWLRDAGINAKSYITIKNPEPGVLIIKMEK